MTIEADFLLFSISSKTTPVKVEIQQHATAAHTHLAKSRGL
jgi:hypothetical protein